MAFGVAFSLATSHSGGKNLVIVYGLPSSQRTAQPLQPQHLVDVFTFNCPIGHTAKWSDSRSVTQSFSHSAMQSATPHRIRLDWGRH